MCQGPWLLLTELRLWLCFLEESLAWCPWVGLCDDDLTCATLEGDLWSCVGIRSCYSWHLFLLGDEIYREGPEHIQVGGLSAYTSTACHWHILDFERIWRSLTPKTFHWDKLLEMKTKKGDKKIVEMTFNTEDYYQLRWPLPNTSLRFTWLLEKHLFFLLSQTKRGRHLLIIWGNTVYHDGEDIISQ